MNPGESDMALEKTDTIRLENGNIYCGDVNEQGLPHGDFGREFCEDGASTTEVSAMANGMVWAV